MSWITDAWHFYKAHQDILTPLLAPLGTILVGVGTVTVAVAAMLVSRQQARTAAQQAVTTAFHNAVSRLASDKIEERLGGIYILERVSLDSLNDHWPVMETLTAFVRARAIWKEPATACTPAMVQPDVWQSDGAQPAPQSHDSQPTPTIDTQAVLTVIGRRSVAGRKREPRRLDLRGTDLRGASLSNEHLEHANLCDAHLEDAVLLGTHLEGTLLNRAHLKGTILWGAYLDGAILHDAEGLTQAQIDRAQGNVKTELPAGLTRPRHWNRRRSRLRDWASS
jgi:hypothetical protein